MRKTLSVDEGWNRLEIGSGNRDLGAAFEIGSLASEITEPLEDRLRVILETSLEKSPLLFAAHRQGMIEAAIDGFRQRTKQEGETETHLSAAVCYLAENIYRIVNRFAGSTRSTVVTILFKNSRLMNYQANSEQPEAGVKWFADGVYDDYKAFSQSLTGLTKKSRDEACARMLQAKYLQPMDGYS